MAQQWRIERERRFIGFTGDTTPLLWSCYYSDGPGCEAAFLGAYATRKQAKTALESFKAQSPGGYQTLTVGPAGVSQSSVPRN